jgi:glycosyltransferase involved in cell wall biosynthesis
MRAITIIGMEPVDVRPGGLNRYASDLAAAYRHAGVEVNMVTHNVPPMVKFGLIKRLWFYFTQGLTDQTSIVDSHFALYGLPYILGRALRGRPPLLTSHFQGPWADESVVADGRSSASSVLKKLVERSVYKRSVLVVVLSQGFKERIVSDYAVDRDRVRIIKPGVDLDRFKINSTDGRRPREHADFQICAVRRLDPRMGLDVAIRAMSLLGTGYTLKIAGVGKDQKRLEELIDELALADRVELVGRLTDEQIVDLYNDSDLSIVPTVALEGFGLVVLESLACGTPVVASRQGGLIDALAPFREDLLFEPGSNGELAAAIRKIATEEKAPSPEDCRAFAELHGWQQVVTAHRKELRRVTFEAVGKDTSQYPQGTACLVICSVNRPDDLRKALQATSQYHRQPDEIIVVTRPDQAETIEVAKAANTNSPLRLVYVESPGLAAAVQTGLTASTCELTCFTDDDSIPFPDWFERIELAFGADDFLVAVGGRDNVDANRIISTDEPVGQISNFGKIYGNHALGSGEPRYVTHLKGVNMGFWTSSAQQVNLKDHIVGNGAQYRNEFMLSLAVSEGKGRVLYDPAIQVDHFPAHRDNDDARTPVSIAELKLDVSNELASLLAYGYGPRFFIAAARTLFIGTDVRPGIFRICNHRNDSSGQTSEKLASLLWSLKRSLLTASAVRQDRRRRTGRKEHRGDGAVDVRGE